ncbi:hypothetical protein GIB67_029314 [Kingdonia uniflora]|uniref:Nucleoporin autopeptidase n=1 Tax=Kingdonia uniflora TaxID=39325 RepID=A0A7J7N8J0_9MAGN|nr:hypothetical protein GIB67_029314 [Kingdonia uniflora]
MFGSTNPFGQSSNSPFGSQPLFGQNSNVNNNPFAPKPFGSPSSPFGSQSGSSIFGGTSTGAFGATSSPLATTTFGATSTPAFGSSAPAFGASPTPAFGSGSSSFGGSSLFGQKPAFGGFGSTPSQTSPFGSTFQQSQSTFGSNIFGASSSSPFGGSSQSAFGATPTPAFGTSNTPAFGAASTPAFGTTTTPAFGSTGTTFGTGSVFGAPSTPTFGSSSTPAFGTSNTNNVFGSSNTPAFGTSSTVPSTAPAFSFSSSPAFGQSNSAFGSSQFGTTSPFGAQSSSFGDNFFSLLYLVGSLATTPTFGSTGFPQQVFGGQRVGSRVAPYTSTAEVDGTTGAQGSGKLESISAMPAYKDKSHEELRWEDYQAGDKGGPNPSGQTPGGNVFGAPAVTTQTNPFGSSSTFGQTNANPFSSAAPSSNLFGPKPNLFGTSTNAFGTTPFGTSNTNPFASSTPATAPSMFGQTSSSPFGTNTSPSLFPSNSSGFGQTSSIFSSVPASGTTPAFGNTQSTGLFHSTTPSSQTSTPFGHSTPPFGNSTPLFGQSTNPFGSQNMFNTAPSTGSQFSMSNPAGGLSQTTSSLSTFQQPQPAQTSGAFSFANNGQTQPGSTGYGVTSNILTHNTFGNLPISQSNMVMQPTPNTNPFGTLPAMPQISIGRNGSAPSVQYGISSLPVAEKPALVRVSSLLTSRHLSQRRIRLPARRYHPKTDGPKVPFFSDDEEAPSTPKADALFIPRENPRALIIRPTEKWPSRASAEKLSSLKDTYTSTHENGKVSGEASAPSLNGSVEHDQNKNPMENGYHKQRTHPDKPNNEKPNGFHHEDQFTQKVGDSDSYITLTGHRAGEAAIVYEHGADIEALMPKLRHSDYYTEPRIQELAAKERAEPGFCRRVKEFVVGRHGYGSIKFIGETDVRRLDLESLVQFNNREVIVYMDENKKPPVGQGLNKPAEVTLLNIKCFDKKTGLQYTEGPKVEKYKEMLTKKTREQDAEFVSYDPLKGEWKFRVNHFSKYNLSDEDGIA